MDMGMRCHAMPCPPHIHVAWVSDHTNAGEVDDLSSFYLSTKGASRPQSQGMNEGERHCIAV